MGIIGLTLGKLEQMISSNTWSPGGRLPPERELAKTLGVGRATLREALRILETRGVLAIKTGSGAYLIAPELLRRPAARAGKKAGPLQQFEAAYCLLPSLAAWCALSAGQETIEQLEQCVSGLGRAFLDSDALGVAQGYARFCRLMAVETANTCLRHMVDSLTASDQCAALDFTNLSDAQRDYVFAGLVQLWGFIRAHEPQAAQKAARRQQVMQALFCCGRAALNESSMLQAGLGEMEKEKDAALSLAQGP